MFGAWLSDVYAATREAWGLSDEDLAGIAAAGVDASFAPHTIRRELHEQIRAWLTGPSDAAPA
jgi:adenosine deaminase